MRDEMNDSSKPERPANCGECARFVHDTENPGHGWCDNWGGVDLSEGDVCHPNFGIRKETKGEAK